MENSLINFMNSKVSTDNQQDNFEQDDIDIDLYYEIIDNTSKNEVENEIQNNWNAHTNNESYLINEYTDMDSYFNPTETQQDDLSTDKERKNIEHHFVSADEKGESEDELIVLEDMHTELEKNKDFDEIISFEDDVIETNYINLQSAEEIEVIIDDSEPYYINLAPTSPNNDINKEVSETKKLMESTQDSQKHTTTDGANFFGRIFYGLLSALMYGIAGCIIDFVVTIIRAIAGHGDGSILWLFAPVLFCVGFMMGLLKGKQDDSTAINGSDDASIFSELSRGLSIGMMICVAGWIILMILT